MLAVYKGHRTKSSKLQLPDPYINLTCHKWGVVAPIDSEWASEAVRRFVRMYDWCLVIVLERKPSITYDPKWYEGEGNKAVVILTPDDAKTYSRRKNFGYHFAITHGAKTI